MKFKAIFGMFNAIILVAFLFVFFMPFIVIGPEATLTFWSENWYVAIIFLLVLGGLDAYFILNWKLFSLLEREDWKGLADYLSKEILEKGRLNDQNIRFACNAAILVGKPEIISQLMPVVRDKKPALFRKHAVTLGLPLLLAQDGKAMTDYFEPLSQSGQVMPEHEWIQFFLAFSHLSTRNTESAKILLDTLGAGSGNVLIRLMSLYFLSAQGGQDQQLEEQKKDFSARISDEKCRKQIESSKDQLQVLLLSKFLDEAHAWMYKTEAA